MPYSVSPSLVARFFFHECERFLRFAATPRASRAEEGVPKIPYDTRPVTQAILEGGFLWEEKVVTEHLRGRVHVAPGTESVRERVHGVEESITLLAALAPGEHLYQPTLRAPAEFYARYGLDPAVVTFADCRPDLIECLADADGNLRLRVVDVKASPGLKLSHRIQASIYSVLLEHVLRTTRITDRTVAGDAGIWLFNQTFPEYFDIRSMRPPLETFLEHELQALLSAPASQARWHLYFRCEWCPYFDHCREEMHTTDDVSRVPYTSTHAKRFLNDLIPPVRDVRSLYDLAADPARSAALDACASLRGRRDRIVRQTAALLDNRVIVHEGHSLAMPRGENVRLLITVQTEPISGQVYAWGVHAQGLKDILGQNPPATARVATSDNAAEIAAVERALISHLHTLLASLDAWNVDHVTDWRAQKSLQVYTFDTYERDLLTGVLLRHLFDAAVSEEALSLFFHFQQPDLLVAENHPADEVFFPIVVLNHVIRELLALPVPVTYRFADVLQQLKSSRFHFDYRGDQYFCFELSNQLRSDAIFAVWTKGKTEYLPRIERELRARLWATNGLVDGIREALHAAGSLFAWPPKFHLPASGGFRSPLISRLAFLARYESVASYLMVRESRMVPLRERLRAHEALRLTYQGNGRFAVDPQHRDADIATGTFPKWILVEENAAGLQGLLSYDDYRNRDRRWVPKNSPVALAGVTDVIGDFVTPNQAVDLEVIWSMMLPRPIQGRGYLLQPRYTDFNLKRIITELRDADASADARALDVFTTPSTALRGKALPESVIRLALELAETHGMTPSQLKAFRGILAQNLQLVWGPPGTGKTHFLALAILCLAEAHRRVARRFRVAVTAFTHAAIDNCLRKVIEIDSDHRIVRGQVSVGKMGSDQVPAGVERVSDTSGAGWLEAEDVRVLGGTCWAMWKSMPEPIADLVVIDEASQVRVPESLIAIRRVRTDGRLLLAGDHRQLPPIVQGTYPDPIPGEPLLHRSIFECLQDRPDSHLFTSTLLENFRMNAVLCRYPAEQIYVPEYRSATDAIASRKLNLVSGSCVSVEDLVIDPGYPLVLGILYGVQATAENVVEAALVARIALRLRQQLLAPNRSEYPASQAGDRAFWAEGLFIVSPHHAQINAIHRELELQRRWKARPFVDTVDKMQGQECDAVITSYGVSDVEYAMQEKEFIYSLNRLNVAITRARRKSIVLLPRPLIEPPIAVYEDDRIAEGVAFMQGLVQHAEHHGSRSDHELDRGRLVLWRVPARDNTSRLR